MVNCFTPIVRKRVPEVKNMGELKMETSIWTMFLCSTLKSDRSVLNQRTEIWDICT